MIIETTKCKSCYQTPQKKAVLLKNCFVNLYSTNDNSIKLPNGEEKPPEVPFNGLYLKVFIFFWFFVNSFLVFQTKRKLSY
ncbi:hypothetical protein B0A70_10540 [Chryseobacterium piscicola]|uniref:Uncharacterized protein n=1 Tax=Chryseobacterium piscicola TaxID=551459 RepID=A0A2S7KEC0_9FLAO|nr:hypothetical protein B0A70_10540 [Chryseobacterium piscicola]